MQIEKSIIENLIKTWENRHTWMLTYAEEGFFARDDDKRRHFETCARQWAAALEEIINAE